MSWRRAAYVAFVVIVAGVSGLAGSLAGGLAVYRAVQTQEAQAPVTAPVLRSPESPTTIEIANTNLETAITQAVDKVGKAVVTIVATIPGQMTYFGYTGDEQVSGSGFIISEDGYIITNNHVVEGAQQVFVVLADGSEIEAEVVGTDRFADLAVVKIEGPVPAVAPLGNSDNLKPGESVIAIGSPLGDLKNTVTVGVVSATGRNLDTGENYQMENLIQTDAAINHGNSGGPLVNLAGEVIGINTLVVRGSGSGDVAEGLGFAVPVNTAAAVVQQILEKGYFARPYLGIRWQWVNPQVAQVYDLPVEWGVYVGQVVSGGPADQAGIQRGDIMVQIGDIPLNNEHPYTNALFTYAPGDTIPIQLYRGEEKMTVQATLAEQENQR